MSIDFLGAEQIMRYDQGAQGVFLTIPPALRMMCASPVFSQGANRKARIHTGQDGELRSGRGVVFAHSCVRRVNFVGGENFVDDAHGQNSLAKQKRGE